MAISSCLFASMNFLARLATASASWATAAAVRAAIGALVAFGVARVRRTSLRPNERTMLFWRSVLGTLSMLSTFYALSSRSMSLGNTVTLLNLSPVFLAVLAPIFLRERTNALVGIAIAISLGGVVLVVRPAFLFGGAAPPIQGVAGLSERATAAVAIGGAFSTSIAMMFLRRAGRTETPEAIAFHFSIFAALTLGTLSLFDFRVPTAWGVVCMVGSGACAGVAQLAMTRAYAIANAARVAGMSYLAVVVSAVLGIFVLGERPATTALGGMVFVIAGGLLLTIPRAARA
jgi:drug/metabolite transporter (DMT)-like permease